MQWNRIAFRWILYNQTIKNHFLNYDNFVFLTVALKIMYAILFRKSFFTIVKIFLTITLYHLD